MSEQRHERVVEREIALDAPTVVVWKALTDAGELMRWFPLEARVSPGRGGSVWMRWDDAYDATSAIEIWEPERHLRISFPHEEGMYLATDYYLEGRGGGTVLRVVTSGFAAGDDWDTLYDGVRRGWSFELLALRHYLERHRGRDRRVAWGRVPCRSSHEDAWRRLTGPGGWFGTGGLGTVAVDARYSARTTTGHLLTGVVRLWQPPLLFAGTVEGCNDALFRLELQGKDGVGELWFWLATYGVPAAEVRSIERAWRTSLETLFEEPAAQPR